ncbi:hypothetical protein EN45_046690 [Penicillium chrysogenum]|uniref:NAD(P)-binding domain-containing protein n=1 Tax=Penicillium chrysogenum TaxID=5076 RepID=A0A161XYW0_PENCH|nr:hypothetical protein EN45_046690 [Penicillium chrysogenum]
MKLIIAGATSLLGTEIVRQSLQIRAITQVISLALQPVQLDKSIDTSKLKNIVIRDYSEYPDDVKAELAGADACIWTVAVTPLRTGKVELKRVCQDYTKLGFKTICEAGPARPFRFIQCNTELMVLKFPTEKEGVEVCIARPGVIANSSTWSRALVANLFRIVNLFGQPLPYVQRSQLAAALLSQVMDGFEKQTLSNADLVRIGQREMNSRSIPQPS